MNISHAWLSDFLTWKERDAANIADAMTKCMGEVDDVVKQGELLEHCVVGKVLKKEKHPNADKLSVCTVETDKGVKTVVCGGTNVREGMLVAFAHIGATVEWHGTERMTLSKVKIRGVESEGMICAQEELGLTAFPAKKEDGEHPIVDLTQLPATSYQLQVGISLKEALKLNDVIFHIDNHAITNRPDLFSHLGVARELVAMGLGTWKKQPSVRHPKFPTSPLSFRSKNSVPTLVPRYLGCTLKISSLGTTPDWMRGKLEAVGIRCINLPVDITNYVAQELGMPLHSFDIGDLSGNIDIRQSKKGESLTTLDGVKRMLPDGAIVLSDDEGIFDLLGIMGGLRSSTKESTRNIYLHAAIVDPVAIRKAIIATNHRTDASTVYEKGIPHSAAEAGFFRALELMLAHIPGAAITSKLETWGTDKKKSVIALPDGLASRVIGKTVTAAETKKILTALGYAVTAKGKSLNVTAPPWRNDVSGTHDLVEDIARIVGYNAIPSVMPSAPIAPPPRDTRLHQLRDSLKESGFTETVHLAFISPDLLSRAGGNPNDAVKVENPLGEELSLLRTFLLPRLLETAAREQRVNPKSVINLFEIGRVFAKGWKEHTRLTLISAMEKGGELSADPMLATKAAMVEALAAAGYPMAEIVGAKEIPPFAHPGRSGNVKVSGKEIGLLTTIHPTVTANFGFTGPVGMCGVDLDVLFAMPASVKLAKSIPEFPGISFDETLPLHAGNAALRTKAKTTSSLLETIDVQSYYGQSSKANVTLRFSYRAKDRTLKEDEAKKEHGKVMQVLK